MDFDEGGPKRGAGSIWTFHPICGKLFCNSILPRRSTMDAIIQTLAQELGRTQEHVQNVVTLIDEGATIPFIARYRK